LYLEKVNRQTKFFKVIKEPGGEKKNQMVFSSVTDDKVSLESFMSGAWEGLFSASLCTV